MNAVLICPSGCPAVPKLEQKLPLAIQTYFGRTLLDYWLEHLAGSGVSHVTVLAEDHLGLVRALVRNGERWGIKAEVLRKPRQLTLAAMRAEYRGSDEANWLPEPHDITLLDHFPGLPQFRLFQTYSGWFEALQQFLPRAAGTCRIGMREIQPGIWVSVRACISPLARLHAPCWIGEHATIGPRCIIGPQSIVEDGAFVESDSEISASVIGPQTFIGKWTEVRRSLAWGESLLNWETGSFVSVPDPFLMCSLSPSHAEKISPHLARVKAAYTRTKSDLQLLWQELLAHKGS